jgi:hypothetical protein
MTRLAGPPYLYDGVNRERGGLVTRQTLVKQDPLGIGDMTNVCCMARPMNAPAEKAKDQDGCAFREAL